jgi:hypothetical protein
VASGRVGRPNVVDVYSRKVGLFGDFALRVKLTRHPQFCRNSNCTTSKNTMRTIDLRNCRATRLRPVIFEF